MTEQYVIPQWLKELLKRGYLPKTVDQPFNNQLFSHVERFSDSVSTFPNKLIFTLEGIPGSGKTSILKMIRSKKGIKTIPQILPSEPHFDQAKSRLFYQNSEELKTRLALSCPESLVLMDRYYVSSLAFYWSFDQIHGTKTYEKNLEWYYQKLQSKILIKPFIVFYINTPIEVGLVRKQRSFNKSLKDLWRNKKFLEGFIYFNNYFYSEIEQHTQVVRLFGTDPLNKLKAKIEEIIDEHSK